MVEEAKCRPTILELVAECGFTIFQDRIRQSAITIGDIVKISSSYQHSNVPKAVSMPLIKMSVAAVEAEVNKGAVHSHRSRVQFFVFNLSVGPALHDSRKCFLEILNIDAY